MMKTATTVRALVILASTMGAVVQAGTEPVVSNLVAKQESAPSVGAGTSPFSLGGLTGSVSTGYDTSCYYRGLWFANNTAWGAASFSVPLAEKWSLGVGTLYTRSLDTDIGGADLKYSELDLSTSLNYDAGFAKFGLVYTHYDFFQTFSGEVNRETFGFAESSDSTLKRTADVGLTMAVPVGAANFYLGAWYDLKISAYYFEIGADYTFKVNDQLSFVPSVQMGYAIDYYTYEEVTGESKGLTHVRTALSAPYKVTNSFTVTPYVAMNSALQARKKLNTIEDQNDLFGGVSLNFAF